MNNNNNEVHHYDDIIHLPRPVSKTHPQMAISDRAAQFAPFAALTGHGDAIRETARFTDEKAELDENAKAILDEKLRMIQELLSRQPEIAVTYFQPDPKKAGGHYLTVTGTITKLNMYTQSLSMADGLQIPFDDIFELDSEMFRSI